MNKNSNSFEIIFDSKSENESFARVVVAAFCTRLDPTLEEISDIKTAVSEAVTNCIVHGYEGREGKISLKCELNDNELTIEVHDDGVGIDDIERAMEPMYTSKPQLERSERRTQWVRLHKNYAEVEILWAMTKAVELLRKILQKGGMCY